MYELDGSQNAGRATKHLEFSPFHIDPEDVRILLSYKVFVESGGVDDHFVLNDAPASPGVIGIDLKPSYCDEAEQRITHCERVNPKLLKQRLIKKSNSR